MKLYENIKLRRKELNLSQGELAKLTGYTDRTSISKIESGKVDLPQSKIRIFAEALHTTEGELMGTTEPPLPSDAISYAPTQRIPILGRISAGLPLYADEQIEGYTYTDLNHGGEYFALRVHGDSMNAIRIYDGDLLIIRKQDVVEDGEIAVVMVNDDEATVKCWHRRENIVMLEPKSTNPTHQMQIYDAKETPIRVIGKVVKVEFTLD